MLNPIELKFKVDKDSKTVFRTEKTIASHDINSVEFHISFDGLELTDTHIVKVLTSFHSSKSQTNVECEIVDGKAIYKPDTSLISRYEQVTCYIYVYHGNQSLAVRDFTYSVDVSKIDETTIRVREVYDQSYARVLLDFEQALQNYKDTLPQADSVRAEIDEILNQFSEDSQVKLNQYDADAQQVIEDNQTAFGVAESGRQATYEQAEDNRNQASNQAVAEWEQGADELVDSKLIEIQTDADSAINQFKQDGADEIADWRVENSGELTALETEISKKANKQQEDWITPTLLNGWYAIRPNEPPQYMKDEFGFVHLRGTISKGASATNNVAFQLPTGYRPSASTAFGIPEINISARALAVSIFTNGNVDFAGSYVNSWYAISYITFKAV